MQSGHQLLTVIVGESQCIIEGGRNETQESLPSQLLPSLPTKHTVPATGYNHKKPCLKAATPVTQVPGTLGNVVLQNARALFMDAIFHLTLGMIF